MLQFFVGQKLNQFHYVVVKFFFFSSTAFQTIVATVVSAVSKTAAKPSKKPFASPNIFVELVKEDSNVSARALFRSRSRYMLLFNPAFLTFKAEIYHGECQAKQTYVCLYGRTSLRTKRGTTTRKH